MTDWTRFSTQCLLVKLVLASRVIPELEASDDPRAALRLEEWQQHVAEIEDELDRRAGEEQPGKPQRVGLDVARLRVRK